MKDIKSNKRLLVPFFTLITLLVVLAVLVLRDVGDYKSIIEQCHALGGFQVEGQCVKGEIIKVGD